MSWHVVYTKPREEFRAQENLENQGFNTFLPLCKIEKIRAKSIHIVQDPLFPRYLFVEIGSSNEHFGPILSTRGVAKLLRHGNFGAPMEVPEYVMENLQWVGDSLIVKAKYQPDDPMLVLNGPFKGLEGFFQRLLTTPSGEVRAMLFIELLGKRQLLPFPVEQVALIK